MINDLRVTNVPSEHMPKLRACLKEQAFEFILEMEKMLEGIKHKEQNIDYSARKSMHLIHFLK